MVSPDMHNRVTIILAVCVFVLILAAQITKSIPAQDSEWWGVGNLVVFAAVVIASFTLEYKLKIMVFIISITWFGSTIIQQLMSQSFPKDNSSQSKACERKDFFIGNLMLQDKLTEVQKTRVIFVMSYLLVVLMVMVVLLYKIDTQSQIFNFINDNLKYVLILLLPVIMVFINEGFGAIALNWYGNPNKDDTKWMTSDLLFKRFVTGGYRYAGNDQTKFVSKIIFTSLFLVLLFILFINYSTGGNIAMLSETLGVGDSNIPVYVAMFILMFFNFIVETLFMQKCSFEGTAGDDNPKGSNDYDGERGEKKHFKCRISKYGGLTVLLFISYTVSILYQINGTRDKVYALLFIMSLTFGFSELFISLKNK
tara:strand:- start:1012 stop:2112 length:1101 start_codon:yes stop_codon:yes gene_type:complete